MMDIFQKLLVYKYKPLILCDWTVSMRSIGYIIEKYKTDTNYENGFKPRDPNEILRLFIYIINLFNDIHYKCVRCKIIDQVIYLLSEHNKKYDPLTYNGDFQFNTGDINFLICIYKYMISDFDINGILDDLFIYSSEIYCDFYIDDIEMTEYRYIKRNDILSNRVVYGYITFLYRGFTHYIHGIIDDSDYFDDCDIIMRDEV
jgi:hypothetical protein